MDSNLASILMMVGVFAVIILMMIIPQRKRKKQLQELMESIKPGKMVKTIGGLYGKVVAVKEDLVTIEALPDKVRLVFTKGAIATVEDSDMPEQEIDRK
ncbi:MAG: preprotein translocase subunit YajC [Christensenellales bacterium]|jgi:preprotein translocase subunit YajC